MRILSLDIKSSISRTISFIDVKYKLLCLMWVKLCISKTVLLQDKKKKKLYLSKHLNKSN